MNVSYILEGSGQKYGNNVRLTFQLLDARNDEHLWSSPYSREIVMEEIFDLQSEIAQLVAAEIEAIITPEEKQRIEKVPTTNLTAYDLYRRGREEHNQYLLDNDNRTSLDRAEELYHDALDYDSTFAQAYTGLADVFWDKHYWESYFSESFLDSVLILADIALSFDPQLSEAYNVRGEYYREIGQTERAIKDFNKALKLNPNHWETYVFLGILYSTQTRYDLAIQNLYRASILHRGKDLPRIFKSIADALRTSGFKDQADAYYLEAFKLDHDTADYFLSLGEIEAWWNNFQEAIKYGEKAFSVDSNSIEILSALGNWYMVLGQFDESLKYFEKNVERLKEIGALDIDDMQRIGYVYWHKGYKEEADYYFTEQINYCMRVIELERSYSQSYYSYFDLAGVYAFKGDKEKAFENLRVFNQKKRMQVTDVLLFKIDPLLDSIRDEPEFQQIVRDVEAKYQAEHERVRKWLEENDML
jgi:tetratricopeptide (TPR) repeat protein